MASPACVQEEGGISPGGPAVLGLRCQILSPLPEVAGHHCPYAGSVSPPWSQGSGEWGEDESYGQTPPQPALNILLSNFLMAAPERKHATLGFTRGKEEVEGTHEQAGGKVSPSPARECGVGASRTWSRSANVCRSSVQS